jgi:hypothetical protein
MGLREDIQGLVAAVPGALGNLAPTVTYRSRTIGAYSAAAGTQTITPSDTTLTAIALVGYSQRERAASGGLIQTSDQKLLVAAADLPGVTPKLEDQVIDAAGVTWAVVDWKQDPAGSLYIIQLRRPG